PPHPSQSLERVMGIDKFIRSEFGRTQCARRANARDGIRQPTLIMTGSIHYIQATNNQRLRIRRKEGVERVMGIEPTLSAWEAEVLPLNYTRINSTPDIQTEIRYTNCEFQH